MYVVPIISVSVNARVVYALVSKLGFKPSYQLRRNSAWYYKLQIDPFHKQDDDNNYGIMRNSLIDHRMVQFEFAQSMKRIMLNMLNIFQD